MIQVQLRSVGVMGAIQVQVRSVGVIQEQGGKRRCDAGVGVKRSVGVPQARNSALQFPDVPIDDSSLMIF